MKLELPGAVIIQGGKIPKKQIGVHKKEYRILRLRSGQVSSKEYRMMKEDCRVGLRPPRNDDGAEFRSRGVKKK